MSNFQRVLIIVLLCVAVIFISGILLPKFLSSQILELRKELNAENGNSKYSLLANSVPDTEKRIQDESSNLSRRNAEEFPSVLNNSLSSRAKRKKRSKRQALSDDYFKWNFNFNVTKQGDRALQESSEIASGTSQKDKHMGIAIFTEGEAKKKSAFSEIQHSLRAVEYFFNFLFNAENFTDQGDIKNEIPHSDTESSKLDAGSEDELSMRGREGKFFNLGALNNIFGFRRSTEKSILSSTTTINETDSVFIRDESIVTETPPIHITENLQEISSLSNLQAQSLVSEALNQSLISTSGSNLPGKTEDGECIDCEGAGLESPITAETVEVIKSDLLGIETEPTEFTDEFLEMFCMSLVNKVGISQHLTDPKDEIFEPKHNTTDEDAILRSVENTTFDSLQTSVSKKELNQFVTENSDKSNDTLISENEIRERFLSFSNILGFGSGRAAEDQDETNGLTSDKLADGVDLGKLPTLVDCENYFRGKNLKMFSKPNLMDIISDPKIQFADFANATISPNLIQQQLEFLTSLLKTNLGNNSEILGKNSDAAMTKSVSDELTLETEPTLKEKLHTELDVFNENDEMITSTNASEILQTDFQRDGKFFSVFGFGSGNDESRSLKKDVFNTDRNEVIGSGDFRSLDSVGFNINKNEFGSGDFRSFEDATLAVDRKELGSGNLKSLWATTFSDRKELGSSDFRSLKTESDTEMSELGSSDLRSLGTMSETDINEVGSGDFRSFGDTFATELSEFGSGDLRSLGTIKLETNEFVSGDFRSLDTIFTTKVSEFGSGDFRSLSSTTFETEIDEFGSGDLRSLEATPDIKINEFGSGDFRSLEATPGIEINELGSGDFRSLEATPEIEINELGSGDFRSLEATPEIEINELGRGDFRSFENRSEIKINEFGSGDFRSLEATPEIEINELGSGDFRSLEATPEIEINELGSGDFRSLEAPTPEIERNGFGSGDFRLLEVTPEIELNELGSGDFRSLEAAKPEIELNELGSGDLRSLEATSEIEINELGSGDFRSLEPSPEIEINELGSGDLRSLEATSEIEINELGSGDFRSLEPSPEIEINELGSGDLRSFEAPTPEVERDGFGSGDLRSLEAPTPEIERNGFGSGDFRLLEVTPEIELNELGSGDFRSLEAAKPEIELNELGSGDLRSLEAITEIGINELGSGDFRSVKATIFENKINELESGNFRPLGVENISEFGSSDVRLLEDVISEIPKTQFGSGDLRSLKTAVSGETNEFGSGDSFKDIDLYEDLKSTKQERFWGVLELAASGDGRDLPVKEFSHSEKKCENCSSEIASDCVDSDCNDRNSNESDSNLLNSHDLVKDCEGDCFDVSVSNETIGESRISSDDHGQDCQNCNKGSIRDTNETNVENEVFPGCKECNSTIRSGLDESQQNLLIRELVINNTKHLMDDNTQSSGNKIAVTSAIEPANIEIVDSIKTQNESENSHAQTTENSQRFLRPIFLTGSGDGGLFGGDSGGPINLLEEEESTNIDTNPHIDDGSVDSGAENAIEEPHELTTDKNTERFLGPIFLTGSGDGGLFEDSGGPINLLEEEESTVKSQNVPLRKGRFNDIPLNFSEAVHENFPKSKQIERPVDGNETKENFTPPVVMPSRRGRVDDMLDVPCDDCNYDYETFIENYKRMQNFDFDKDASLFKKRINTESDKNVTLTSENKSVTADSSDVITSTRPFLPDLAKETMFKARPCTAARECNVTLNERCVARNSSRVCGCSKGYARNKETSKCIVKKIVETSMKLPGERFEEDLKNPFSPNFQRKRKSALEMVMLLLQNDPELLRIISEIEILKFSAGSLVITLNLVFATENKSEAQLIRHVEDDFLMALQDETLVKSIPLNISNASLISVNGEIDYCKSSELNYCSENAYCVSNPVFNSSYTCYCKEHYRDVSLDPRHTGEACLAKCPKDYCGKYGHCEPLANDEKICLCSGLYFGRRCEVPGLYVLIALAFVGFVSFTMLLLVVFKRRCSRFSYAESEARGTNENGVHSHMNGKVSDAIALEENIGTSKFVTISTPIPHPAIKITRPTVTESGSSYDFDSTFDSTPASVQKETNSTGF